MFSGDCDVCGCEQVEIHNIATCDRCRAAAGRFAYWSRSGGADAAPSGAPRPKIEAEPTYAETFACSFCGRLPNEVNKMFSGPWAFICDGCVALAVEALNEDAPPPTARRKNTGEHEQPREITQVGRPPTPDEPGSSNG